MASKLSDADVAAVQEVVEANLRFIESGDVEQWFQCFTEDATIMPSGMPSVTGHAQLKAFTKDNWATQPITMSEVHIDGRDDLAVLIAHVTLPGAGAGGGTLEGKHMHKLIKQPDGVWRIETAIYNWDVPSSL